MKIKKFNNLKSKLSKGFTLIELLVTITIFVILTGIVLFSSNGFNNTILLKDLAYDVALTIQQAQSYGINVNESKLIMNPFAPFGVYFNLNTASGSGSIYNFIFFNDVLNGSSPGSNNKYDTPSTSKINTCGDSECISKYTIDNGNYIKSICVGSNSSDCSSANVTDGFTILFTRPNPNAIITTEDSSNNITGHYNYADIQVASPNGQTKDVIVNSIGLIYVQ